MSSIETQTIKTVHADPAALGLFGLAMVTLVASSQKLGLTTGQSLILSWAIFLGSFAQLFACVVDCKKDNIFGATAFGAFGLFWLGVAGSWMIKMGVFGAVLAAPANMDIRQLGVGFIGYLIFTAYMTIGSLGTSKVLFAIFVLIDFLFIGLALSTFKIAPEASHLLAAYSELLIALLSFYGSAACVLNTHFGKVVLPTGKPFIAVVKK
jgi:uncharacterized protein